MKKTLLIALLLVTAMSFTVGCGKKEEKPSANTNDGIVKPQTVEGFEIKRTALVYENNQTSYTTEITNTTSEDKYLRSLLITFKDKDGNTIEEMSGYVGKTLKPNENYQLISYSTTKLTDAHVVTYSVIK